MKRFYFLLLFIGFGSLVYAQPLSSSQIDSLVQKTLTSFNVPGISVGIVKDGKLIHAKGYGVISIINNKKTDENTLFGVASNSKAFTAAALGMLMDEGKLTWDDKVIKYIPEFKMYDDFVTREFTIRDLLTHRSGLGLGAGDLMVWPDSGNFSTKDIIHNLRYLKPVSSFRTKYDYDNLLYIVAGEVVARVSGMSWEDFIEKRFFAPLGMTASKASYHRIKDYSNVISAHAPVNGKLVAIGQSFTQVANAAGGINSNITDMSKWITALMNNGKYGPNLDKTLISESVLREMWTPQTIIRGSSPYNTHFTAYGLGFFLSDVNGYLQVTHTGGLAGIVTQVTMIPELKLGIIVLTNQQSGSAFTSITNQIKDSYFGIKGKDRIKENLARMQQGEENARKITEGVWKDIDKQLSAGKKPVVANYTGTYQDVWFGDITVSEKNGKLWFDAKRSPKLTGEMLFYKDNTFIVKWNDRSMDADAYIYFKTDNSGKATGATMKPVSPLTDFSFDFQDLEFKRSK